MLVEILEGIDFVVLGCHSIRKMNRNPGRSSAADQHEPDKPK